MKPAEKNNVQLAILKCVKRISLEHFNSFIPEAQVAPLKSDQDMSHDHWVSSVILTTEKASVFLRVHFSSATGRSLIAGFLEEDPDVFSPDEPQDFLKEFCNVVMGRAKGFLSSNVDPKNKSEVFIPEITPSYDEFGVIPTQKEKIIEEDWWRITWGEDELILYGKAKAMDGFTAEALEALGQETIISIGDDGEVDFF